MCLLPTQRRVGGLLARFGAAFGVMLLMRSSNSKNLSGSDRVKTSPLAVQFWLWGQDALTGDLEAQGFRKTPNPEGGARSAYSLCE
jgi:hypothetical protein